LKSDRLTAITLALKGGVLLVLVLLVWTASRAGAGKFLTAYAEKKHLMSVADMAVKISPADADAHLTRAQLLANENNLQQTIAECERAANLRPGDYVIWLNVARVRELNGQPREAIEAAMRATSLAPFYAQPHWLLGNMLIRAGETERGFRELSAAAKADPLLFPSIIDLAWQLSHGDPEFVKRSIQPFSSQAALAAADCFQKHGQLKEAIAMLGSAGSGPDAIAARKKVVRELTAAGNFNEALELWNFDRKIEEQTAPGKLLNPGFEDESDLNEGGFGWRVPNPAQNVRLSLDPTGPREGRSSLLIEFKGDSSATIISQLVLIATRTHYVLRASWRAQDVVTGGPPHLRVLDATDNRVLGETGPLSGKTGGWRDYAIDFTSGDSSPAIRIAVERQQCNSLPCPIFGKLWLDSLALEKK
jgi:tetratricopeptide (TPR) repeat protein